MGLVKPLDMNYVPKRWGYELWITNNEKYCGKILFIKQGHYCSFHWHEQKDEVLYVQSGRIWFNYRRPDDDRILYEEMGPGHAFHVEPGLRHQMEAIEDTIILEFSTQHFDEDSFRETTDLVINHGNTPDRISQILENQEEIIKLLKQLVSNEEQRIVGCGNL